MTKTMPITIHATKAVVRAVPQRNIRVMYVTNGQHELIVDSEMSIQYMNPELREFVFKTGSVKFLNDIATVILEVEDNVIIATYTVRTVDTLVCEKMTIEEFTPEYFRDANDDEPSICNKTKIYGKLESELKKRIWDMESLVSGRTELDEKIMVQMYTLLRLVDAGMNKQEPVVHGHFVTRSLTNPTNDVDIAMQEAAYTKE